MALELIPRQTRLRLLRLIQVLAFYEEEWITSKKISEFLGCPRELVRQDLHYAGCSAGTKRGYRSSLLKAELLERLGTKSGLEQKKLCCIVGLGRLGAALLDTELFSGSGFSVAAGFDSSVNRLEIMRSTFELYPANRIESVVPHLGIEYAILCCSQKEAQTMTNRLVAAGIKGIVNYTDSIPIVPPHVRITHVSPVSALLALQTE